MRMGMIGAGAIAQAIAGHAVKGGHEVVLSNRRGPAALAELVDRLGPLASAATPAQAAEADLVVLAVGWPDVAAAIEATGVSDWGGRIVVDTTNAFASVDPLEAADLGDATASEHVASLLPGARVVKAFNTLYARYIAADPVHAAGRQLLFLAGDDAEAKQVLVQVTEGFGFAPVDVGPLRDGGRLMQLGGPLSALHALRQAT